MNISNLVFFNSKGYQIPVQYNNSITFTIIGNMYRSERNYGWREDAEGYITLNEDLEVASMTLTKRGSTYGFDPATWSTNINYHDSVLHLIDEIRITITINGRTYVKSFLNNSNSDNIFTYFDITTNIRKEFTQQSVNEEYPIYVFYIDSISVKDPETFIEEWFSDIEGLDIEQLYPSSQFLSTIDIEPVSTELAGTETIFILEKQDDGTFKRPRSNNQNIRIEFANNSTTKVVKYAEDFFNEDCIDTDFKESDLDYSRVYWSNYKVFDLVSEFESEDIENEPLCLTIGFLSHEEGCYQDIMSVLTVDNISNTDKSIERHKIGYFVCQGESIGEDERYRTLFTNFGIPDPKTYSTLFKDADIKEEGEDWKLINKKSKQLFLSYHEIFPYVGTYKALINAVKFLGYDDIYFKEWYMHFDGDYETKISYDSIDVSNGVTLQSKLKRAGVTFDEFIEWKKLNQLSLMYKINEQSSDYEDVYYYQKDENGIGWFDGWNLIGKMRYEIPDTKAIYSYFNLEVLAKLYALKEWLEKYILNINCQIIDVTGEGVYFARFKETAYSVGYETFSDIKEEHISPMFDQGLSDLSMKQSSAIINCTLKEIHNGNTYLDLADKSIKNFINRIYETYSDSSIEELKKNEWYNESSLGYNEEDFCIVGKPTSVAIPFNEIGYELNVATDSGTIKKGVGYYDPSTGDFVELPLLIMDNEAYIFGNQQNEIEFSTPPVLRFKSALLKHPFGDWNTNTKYSIQTYFDVASKHTKYTFQSEETGFHREYNDYVTLYPRYVTDENGNKKYISKFKYTSLNKYNVPMFIIENYDTFDEFFLNEKKAELTKRYLDSSTSINEDYKSSWKATPEEIERIDEKRKNLHQNITNIHDQDLNEFMSMYNSDEYVPGFNKYIIVVDEGYIENKEDSLDSSVEVTSKIMFEPQYSDGHGEQLVWAEYNYRSDMLPILFFDSSTFESGYQEFRNEYDNKIADIDSLIYDLSVGVGAITQDEGYTWVTKEGNSKVQYYQAKIDELEVAKSNYIQTLRLQGGKGKSFEEYIEKEISDIEAALSRMKKLRDNAREDIKWQQNYIKNRYLASYNSEKEKAYSDLLMSLKEFKDSCFVFNKSMNITVNHIGKYELIAKGTDGYDTPYANIALDRTTVYSTAPEIIINDSNSENADAYISPDDLKIDKEPEFWPNYRRCLIDTGVHDSSFTYMDHSYIYDTPKTDDFLKMSNLTERVNSIEMNGEGISDGQIRIRLNDENPQNQNLFYQQALVNLYFIDRNSNELINENDQFAGPFIVNSYQEIPKKDIQEDDQNWIILDFNPKYEGFKTLSASIIDRINNREIDCFAGLVSRIEITLDDIVNDYTTRTSKIYVKDFANFNNMAFKKNQCIKIVFSEITYEGKTSSTGEEKTDIITEKYISGTTYRIKDAYYDNNAFAEVYELDGLVNSDLLIPGYYKNDIYNYLSDTPDENIRQIPYKVKCVITPAHSTYVSYIVQATDDATEYQDKGVVNYRDNWYGKDYLDQTFSYTIYKFNVYDAYRDWFNSLSSDVLYTHREPTINQVDNKVVISSENTSNAIENNDYLCIWDVIVNQGKSKSDNTLAYQVTNDNVSVTLSYPGEYHFDLTAIDKYGNRTYNHREGFIKVESETMLL